TMVPYRFAASFLESFLNGTTPQGAQPPTFSTVRADELSHAVGVNFTSGGVRAEGPIRQYTFPPGSGLGREILTSNAFQLVLNQMTGAGCLDSSRRPTFNGNITFASQSDLYLTFGEHATLDVTLSASGRQAMVQGSLRDLYDWDFDGSKIAPLDPT